MATGPKTGACIDQDMVRTVSGSVALRLVSCPFIWQKNFGRATATASVQGLSELFASYFNQREAEVDSASAASCGGGRCSFGFLSQNQAAHSAPAAFECNCSGSGGSSAASVECNYCWRCRWRCRFRSRPWQPYATIRIRLPPKKRIYCNRLQVPQVPHACQRCFCRLLLQSPADCVSVRF
ncbi:GL17243 [Drosophila persimilis]|uniref:GL17243 n=1 Tax=Drosophila persimilis TaxID=7234 RepID=B4GIR3_DROPE|nr:GL17243 [Drosophila persimilis]